jgi:uncharacterized protein (DUF305 family)
MNDRHHTRNHQDGSSRAYVAFAVNMGLSLIIMYLVMFSMIDGWHDFRNNLNMFYMALTMVAPMGILMLVTMRGMYPNRRANLGLHVGLAILFFLALAGTRTQAFIGDRGFIDAMIPHHSGAILMCREAQLADPELVELCRQITAAQRREIDQMETIRARLD